VFCQSVLLTAHPLVVHDVTHSDRYHPALFEAVSEHGISGLSKFPASVKIILRAVLVCDGKL
jgi:hypothetical protein